MLYQESYPWDDPTLYHKGHLYYQRSNAGKWSKRLEVGDSVFFGTGSIAIDQLNRIHLFWQRFANGSAELVHAVAVMPDGDGPDKNTPTEAVHRD